MALFTVCIPVYNGALFLGEALASVAQQDLDGVEVLVSDNASSDATPQILEDWRGRLPLRVIRQAQTLPMRAHFNALLDAVGGDAYMLLCHDDYLVDRDALAKARGILAENPEVSAVYCDLLYVDELRRPLARRHFRRSGRFSAEEVGRQTLRSGRNCFGIPLAIRREALGELRYDNRFLYTMDVDLSWAVSRTSPAYHIPEPLIANRYSSGNSTWRLLKYARQEYIDLTEKYIATPSRLGRLRIGAVCSLMALQKLAFRGYERVRSWAA
jgi:glycosyltransferase involved in cell wall biosynthesis